MDLKQITLIHSRHNPTRVKMGMEWEAYLYHLITAGVSFFEVTELAGFVGVSETVIAEIEIRLYERIGESAIIVRAVARWQDKLAQSA